MRSLPNATNFQPATNLIDYQATHPGLLSFALNSMKIVEVNQRAVDLFGAKDAQQVFGPIVRLWSESPEVCLKSMQRRYEGGASFEAKINSERLAVKCWTFCT